MADILKPSEYTEEMIDPLLKKAVTVAALDLTGDIPDADHTFVVYYGLDANTEIVVQLIEERNNVHRKSLILPLSSYQELPHVAVIKFLGISRWLKPALIARLVRENAP